MQEGSSLSFSYEGKTCIKKKGDVKWVLNIVIKNVHHWRDVKWTIATTICKFAMHQPITNLSLSKRF